MNMIQNSLQSDWWIILKVFHKDRTSHRNKDSFTPDRRRTPSNQPSRVKCVISVSPKQTAHQTLSLVSQTDSPAPNSGDWWSQKLTCCSNKQINAVKLHSGIKLTKDSVTLKVNLSVWSCCRSSVCANTGPGPSPASCSQNTAIYSSSQTRHIPHHRHLRAEAHLCLPCQDIHQIN